MRTFVKGMTLPCSSGSGGMMLWPGVTRRGQATAKPAREFELGSESLVYKSKVLKSSQYVYCI